MRFPYYNLTTPEGRYTLSTIYYSIRCTSNVDNRCKLFPSEGSELG